MALTPESASTTPLHNPSNFSAALGLPYLGDYPRTYTHEGGFPAGFVWGSGTAAYQIEGAWNEGGRGPSIWDDFSGAGGPAHEAMVKVGAIAGGGGNHSGAVACDHYHRYREDVQLMASLGLRHYRFSLSWPRILPNGTLAGGVNEEGAAFYDALIDALIAAKIEPFVTLYHWDLPSALQTAASPGWLSAGTVRHFEDFARLCFERWGGKVRRWVTFNEPWTFTVLGYGSGSKAPGNPYADVRTGPYLAGHNVLLAHAAAVRAFRETAAASGGAIGITNNIDWREPLTAAPEDVAAAERAREWWLAWFCDPIWRGDYPPSMRASLGERLPTFTPSELESLQGSADFFGLNHYGSSFVVAQPNGKHYGKHYGEGNGESYWRDYEALALHSEEMKEEAAASAWLYSVPWGLRKLLSWVKRRYGNPPLYVTENGWSTPGNESVEAGVADGSRVRFLANYTSELRRAIYEDGVDVRGYYAWSLLDNFEWEMGYSERFGLVYTDYATQRRHPKASARWLAAVASANALVDPAGFAGAPPAPPASCGAALQVQTQQTQQSVKAAEQLALEAEAARDEAGALEDAARRARALAWAFAAAAAALAAAFALLVRASPDARLAVSRASGGRLLSHAGEGRLLRDEGRGASSSAAGGKERPFWTRRIRAQRSAKLPTSEVAAAEELVDQRSWLAEEEEQVVRVVEEAVREAELELHRARK